MLYIALWGKRRDCLVLSLEFKFYLLKFFSCSFSNVKQPGDLAVDDGGGSPAQAE